MPVGVRAVGLPKVAIGRAPSVCDQRLDILPYDETFATKDDNQLVWGNLLNCIADSAQNISNHPQTAANSLLDLCT